MIPGPEAVFEAPWQARAFALAVSLQEQGVLPVPDFARRLGAELVGSGDGQEAYYSAWLDALETFLLEAGLISAEDVDAVLALAASGEDAHDEHHDHSHDHNHGHGHVHGPAS